MCVFTVMKELHTERLIGVFLMSTFTVGLSLFLGSGEKYRISPDLYFNNAFNLERVIS